MDQDLELVPEQMIVIVRHLDGELMEEMDLGQAVATTLKVVEVEELAKQEFQHLREMVEEVVMVYHIVLLEHQ